MIPKNCHYTEEHEWVRLDGDSAIVGITAYAAEQLGDVTYVEVPKPGMKVKAGDAAASVESVKAASDVYAPIGGTVSEVNASLEANPELVNQSAFEDGWFFKLTDVNRAEVEALMDAAAYEQFLSEQTH